MLPSASLSDRLASARRSVRRVPRLLLHALALRLYR